MVVCLFAFLLVSRQSSQLTRLTFCTCGVLIRRLMVDPLLASVSYVIVDEVHERGLEVGLRVYLHRLKGSGFRGVPTTALPARLRNTQLLSLDVLGWVQLPCSLFCLKLPQCRHAEGCS